MSNHLFLTTRTVVCPRCRADATLSHTAATNTAERSRACRRVVYLCPNMCAVSPDEITALLNRDD